MKSQYEQDFERRLASLETNYGYLKKKSDQLDKDDELEQKLATARSKLSELKKRGEDAWEDVKDKAENAWDELDKAFEKLKARVKN